MPARTNTKIKDGQINKSEHSATRTPALERASSLIRKGDYLGAANLLISAGRDPQVRNTLGVCLMRLGRHDDAVAVFRQFVLMPGSVTERAEISNICKRNFATALLMKGFPSGALAVLAETHESNHPMAVQIRAAIKRWEKSLPWLRRLDWKVNGIEPPRAHIPLDFEPGELEFEVTKPQPDEPSRQTLKLAV